MSAVLTATAWGVLVAAGLLLVRRLRRGDVLGTSVLVLVSVAWFFKVVFPGWRWGNGPDDPGVIGIAMLVTGRDLPLPVPSAAFAMYMGVTAIGVCVAVSSNDAWLDRATAPILRLLRGEHVNLALRGAVLYAAVPGLVGWWVFDRNAPSPAAPVESRQAHPSIRYEAKAVNPFRAAGTPDPDAVREGRELFAKNCRPCHGMQADGTGPMARGFRLRPANFRDPGTIATLVEPYARQRVLDGGIGLPANGSPWDSAMPRWKDDLEDEDVWKILLAEYQIAQVNPRVPEEDR